MRADLMQRVVVLVQERGKRLRVGLTGEFAALAALRVEVLVQKCISVDQTWNVINCHFDCDDFLTGFTLCLRCVVPSILARHDLLGW